MPLLNISEIDVTRRWYDQQPEISTSVKLLTTFPKNILAILADRVVQLIEKNFDLKSFTNSKSSHDTQKILSLYKSKQKRRDVDQEPTLHKALNHLFVLPDNERAFMGGEIQKMISHIFEYLQFCKQNQLQASLADVSWLSSSYVEQGAEEVQLLMNAVKHRISAKASVELEPVQEAEKNTPSKNSFEIPISQAEMHDMKLSDPSSN